MSALVIFFHILIILLHVRVGDVMSLKINALSIVLIYNAAYFSFGVTTWNSFESVPDQCLFIYLKHFYKIHLI